MPRGSRNLFVEYVKCSGKVRKGVEKDRTAGNDHRYPVGDYSLLAVPLKWGRENIMSNVTESGAERLEKINRYLMIAVALLVISVILLLIIDFG